MILVTGGAGYIGSHCALRLLEKNVEVVIFDNLSTGHEEIVENLKNYGTLFFEKGDLKNYDDINTVLKKYKIDTVIHFAGYSQVAESVKNPQKYYDNNVNGSLNLFKSMIENDIKQVVFSSSAAVYGEPEYIPIDENHPKTPINPYGNSKLMIEKMLESFDSLYGLKSVCLRYFNVAGADEQIRTGEWHEPETHLIPNILKSTFSGETEFKIFGDDYDTPDGTCVRDYINIDDLINAHLLAVDYLNKSNTSNFFNLGTNEGNTVKQILKICEEVTGKKIDYSTQKRREGDPASLVADNKKVLSTIGWKPEKDIYNSIKTAYLWEKVLQNKN